MHSQRYSSSIKSSSFLDNQAGKHSYIQFRCLINAVTCFDCWTRTVFVTMYSAVQCLCGLPLTQHCYMKPWAPCSSAQLCCHPLQACSKHSSLSGQQAAALLSLAKQLTASTVVTRVKRALSLTHKHMLGGLPLPVHARNEKGRACAASYGQRGDGLGQSHSHSAVMKHVPFCTHLQKNTQDTRTENTNVICCCSPLLVFSTGNNEGRPFQQIIAMCWEKLKVYSWTFIFLSWKEYTFLIRQTPT